MNIIFDLDGTLIDSSAAILASVKNAFEKCDMSLSHTLSSSLIGPPLYTLLEYLTGTDDPAVLDSLAGAFKQSYDTDGYKETEVFSDVEALLSELKQWGASLFIATNKRIVPTEKIISFLGWEPYFTGVYALDSFTHTDSKAAVIGFILKQYELNINDTVYVGDTMADYEAAKQNNLDYVMVTWGYGEQTDYQGKKASSPLKLLELIKQL